MAKYVAVVVGLNYAAPAGAINPLQFAEADAQAMAAALRASGYQVDLLLGSDATRARILTTIQHSRGGVDPDGVFVLHFAGHGALEPSDPQDPNSIAYLLPADADPTSLMSSAIELNQLAATYLPRQVSSLALLDCCHSGAATGTRDITSGGDSGAGAAGFLQRTRESFMSGNWERIVLAACPGDATARELPDLQHGAFTYYVLDHWQHSPDAVDVNTLFEAVSHQLAGRHMPEPVMGGVQNGAFVLRPAQAPPAAAPKPAPPAAAPAPATASAPISPEEAAQRARLYGTLTALDDGNWTALLTRLDVNPDNLPAGGRAARTRGLIADWAGQGLLSALESEVGLAAATQAAAAVRDAASLWPRQQAAIAAEDWDTAITLGRQILQEDPHQESARAATRDAYIARGDAHVEAGAADAALADYGDALALDPHSALAYNQRGLALESFERYDDALADYTQAVARDPGNATTLANRANVLLMLNRTDEALADFTAALEHAEDALIYNGRGLTHQALEQYDEAVADYTQAIALDADFALAYFNRGLLYHEQLGNRRGAMTDFNRAIRLDETLADAYIARGNLNLDLEHADKALEDFSRALEIDDQAVAAFLGRADAYRALGQTRKANADLARARALDPTIE